MGPEGAGKPLWDESPSRHFRDSSRLRESCNSFEVPDARAERRHIEQSTLFGQKTRLVLANPWSRASIVSKISADSGKPVLETCKENCTLPPQKKFSRLTETTG